MTRYEHTTWSRLGDAARALGDAVATPRGAAPGRADRSAAMRRAQI
ncbi:MAG TPA: hypothetical protein VFZ86_05315 [Thermoleophilia bacterium]|nr:hypothetical protein [Thermoleophilia bacterium]